MWLFATIQNISLFINIAVDECTTGDHNCDSNADSTDTATSFTCQCKDGFEGNGTTCVAIGITNHAIPQYDITFGQSSA